MDLEKVADILFKVGIGVVILVVVGGFLLVSLFGEQARRSQFPPDFPGGRKIECNKVEYVSTLVATDSTLEKMTLQFTCQNETLGTMVFSETVYSEVSREMWQLLTDVIEYDLVVIVNPDNMVVQVYGTDYIGNRVDFLIP